MKEKYKSEIFKDITDISLRGAAFERGERYAAEYSQEKLFEMLKSRNIEEVYDALGAIGKLKLNKALPILKNIALYDEDIETQEDAICTIRRIGGRKALDILRFLKTTEHKGFIEEILKYGISKFLYLFSVMLF
jgi:hypothetical protein